jgi:hypothetical protein
MSVVQSVERRKDIIYLSFAYAARSSSVPLRIEAQPTADTGYYYY